MNLLDYLWPWRKAPAATATSLSETAKTSDGDAGKRLARQTEKVMWLLGGISLISVVILAIWSGAQPNWANAFTWALLAALAATFAGGALGLLFGLPTAQTAGAGQAVAAAGQAATAAGRTQDQKDEDVGYRESTSLEQIADWLTKILIGLTLTQFRDWRDQFSGLASDLTQLLTGRHVPLPGGMLLAFYAIFGFLMAYLWMRRYFIHELVAANVEARALRRRAVEQIEERARKEREAEEERASERLRQAEQAKGLEAAERTRLAESAPERQSLPQHTETILKRTVNLLPTHASGVARIRKALDTAPTDPEDPWRGKFGGAALVAHTILRGHVSPMETDPSFFQVTLEVSALTQARTDALLGKKAVYFLHPTFGDEPRVSVFGADGRAPLELYAYGAFTVGVLLEDGTMLELNLATLEGAPDRFRQL